MATSLECKLWNMEIKLEEEIKERQNTHLDDECKRTEQCLVNANNILNN